MMITDKDIKKFDASYDDAWETTAYGQCGEFLERFPLASLEALTLRSYAIGVPGEKGFCYWVEHGTKAWASIFGATSEKFGVYFGKAKHDATIRFRYTQKFSEGFSSIGSERKVFNRIKQHLLSLVEAGRKKDFAAIDENPLSQMFKAKILSLYFRDVFVNICSGDHLKEAALALVLASDSPSFAQHKLLEYKKSHKTLKHWTTQKFMILFYKVVLDIDYTEKLGSNRKAKGKPKKIKRRVDFDELRAIWDKKGKLSEDFAKKFEMLRLRTMGLESFISKIKDVRDIPAYGFDFESVSGRKVPRYIEVKTLTAGKFHLSANQQLVATSKKHADRYYFYLVEYEGDEPVNVIAEKAKTIFAGATLTPESFLVVLDD